MGLGQTGTTFVNKTDKKRIIFPNPCDEKLLSHTCTYERPDVTFSFCTGKLFYDVLSLMASDSEYGSQTPETGSYTSSQADAQFSVDLLEAVHNLGCELRSISLVAAEIAKALGCKPEAIDNIVQNQKEEEETDEEQ